MGLYLWLTLYLYLTAQASCYIFLSGFLPDGNVQWLLFFAEWGPNSGGSTRLWSLQNPAAACLWACRPPSGHPGLCSVLMMSCTHWPWLGCFRFCPGLCPQPVSTQKPSHYPFRVQLTWSYSGETSPIPCPTCSHTASPSCFRDTVCIYIIIPHITWLVVHLYTVRMAISPSGG